MTAEEQYEVDLKLAVEKKTLEDRIKILETRTQEMAVDLAYKNAVIKYIQVKDRVKEDVLRLLMVGYLDLSNESERRLIPGKNRDIGLPPKGASNDDAAKSE